MSWNDHFVAERQQQTPPSGWCEHFTLQQLETLRKVVYVRGKTPNGALVCGTYIGSNPGICLTIRLGNHSQRIINDFAYTTTPPSNMCHAKVEPIGYASPLGEGEELNLESPTSRILTPWTIHFWLTSGYTTKPYLTTEELQAYELVDPMSEEGLSRWVKPAPFLHPTQHIHSHIRATKTDIDYFQPDDAEYFMETGEQLYPEEGHMAPKPIASRIAIKKNEQLNEWHLAKAMWYREMNLNEVRIGSECGMYSTNYRFDYPRHILFVTDTNPQRELSFQVRLLTHPSSTVTSPVAPFTLRPAPEAPPMSPITSLESVDLDTSDYNIHRPKPIRVDSYKEIHRTSKNNEQYESDAHYADLITGLSETALDEEKYEVEKNLVEAGNKLHTILTEEERRHCFSEKVSRLTTSQITEGLEVHHRTMKTLYRRGNLSEGDTYAIWLAEEWCMAAYEEMRKRR